MPLELEQGKQVLQLLTSRHNDWRWRKKIEKTLGLPPSGFKDEKQRAIFVYLKERLKAYKSRRADPETYIVGGLVTQEVIERARFRPTEVGADLEADDVSYLGKDPGPDIDETWWEEMLVLWYQEKEELEAFDAEVEASERAAIEAKTPTETPASNGQQGSDSGRRESKTTPQ